MENQNEKTFPSESVWYTVDNILKNFIDKDHIEDIIDEIFPDIVEDIKTTSAWEEEGYFNDSDVRLALSRALHDKICREEPLIINIQNLKENNYLLFAYDGCHKIYLIENKDEIKEATEYGYELLPIRLLKETYENSCELKFINFWNLSKNPCYLVPQFEYQKRDIIFTE